MDNIVETATTTPCPQLVYEAHAVPAKGFSVGYAHGMEVSEPRPPQRVQVMDDRKKIWTYECQGSVEVGQLAICPDGRHPEVSWIGQVVAIGSDYKGPCKRVKKVVDHMPFQQRLKFETTQKCKKAFLDGQRAAVVWQDLVVRTSSWRLDAEYVKNVKEMVLDVLWGLRAKQAPAVTKDEFIAELEATKPK